MCGWQQHIEVVDRNNFILNCQRCVQISFAITLVGVDWKEILFLPPERDKRIFGSKLDFNALKMVIAILLNIFIIIYKL